MSPNELREQHPQLHVMPITMDNDAAVYPVEQWRETDIEITLDSGACDHIMDAEDAPGYVVEPSVGSRRGKCFTVGNGARVPNEGQMRASMEAEAQSGDRPRIQSTFQVAEISRPLMSVSKICDQGYGCLFTKEGAQVLDQEGKEICKFGRSEGLYVSTMKLKPPEPFRGQAP